MLILGIPDDLRAATGIGHIVEELRTRETVIAIILFGSVARRKARKFSDIDLCIVTPLGISESERLDLLSYGSRRIDVSLFLDLPLTIRFRVIREGELVCCRDHLTLHRIIVHTTREYLDSASLVRKHSLHALGLPR